MPVTKKFPGHAALISRLFIPPCPAILATEPEAPRHVSRETAAQYGRTPAGYHRQKLSRGQRATVSAASKWPSRYQEARLTPPQVNHVTCPGDLRRTAAFHVNPYSTGWRSGPHENSRPSLGTGPASGRQMDRQVSATQIARHRSAGPSAQHMPRLPALPASQPASKPTAPGYVSRGTTAEPQPLDGSHTGKPGHADRRQRSPGLPPGSSVARRPCFTQNSAPIHAALSMPVDPQAAESTAWHPQGAEGI